MSLSLLDYGIIVLFFAVILCVGLAMSRKAGKSLEGYFLGGRNLPWYFLGISGMSAWFDLTGTMIITSFLFMLGPLGLYIEFRGGAVLVLAFLLAYAGKWHRRSGCMTPAEWNTYRFGTGFSAELLRLATALVGIVTTVGMLAYLVRGATLFMGTVFPVDPTLLTVGVLGFASIYTVLSGFYGVVLTDLVQGCIMIAGCLIVSFIAWHRVPDAATLAAVAKEVTGNANWVASAPVWHATMPKGYEAYQSLILAASFYLLRNVLGGMAGGADARFFASRTPREASLQCLLQGLTVMFRWPLMIGFAILGLFLVAKTIPDLSACSEAANAVHAYVPGLASHAWHDYTSALVRHPENAPVLVGQLAEILGADWQRALLLVGPNGTVDPEMVLPAVLMGAIGPGLRGILIVSLLAALMGALTGLVNSASALFVRDIYQNFLRPKASTRELIFQAHLSSVAIVVLGFVMGLTASNINDIWSWIIMGLTAGALGPGLLRLYWWRTNAWGMAAGLFVGGVAAVLQRILMPEMSEWIQFALMSGLSLGATVVVSLLTAPTPEAIVERFYRTTRPFGLWKPFRERLPAALRSEWAREHRFEILSAAVALVWQVTLFLLPMQFLTHNMAAFLATLPFFLASCAGLYFFWWKRLPPPDEEVPDFASPSAKGEPMLH
ncbi:MAG TPA: hypothetical protein VIM58_07180 [Candidatus Methylacidiphilales bacterium]